MEWTLRSIKMDLFAFPDGLETVMIFGRHSFVFVDLRPPKQQMIEVQASMTWKGMGTRICLDLKPSTCLKETLLPQVSVKA